MAPLPYSVPDIQDNPDGGQLAVALAGWLLAARLIRCSADYHC